MESSFNEAKFKKSLRLMTRRAGYFVSLYYSVLDETRHHAKYFYRPQSTIIWNGNKISQFKIQNFLLNILPQSKHKIISVDIQPMKDQNCDYFLVNVNGEVAYDTEPPKSFSQCFILVQQPSSTGNSPNTYFILNETFRHTKRILPNVDIEAVGNPPVSELKESTVNEEDLTKMVTN